MVYSLFSKYITASCSDSFPKSLCAAIFLFNYSKRAIVLSFPKIFLAILF